MDLTDTIVPRSDQLNGDDLFASPRTVTITDVRAGNAEQPVDIHLEEFPGRPFKPSKTVRRILVAAWGKDGDTYVGRRLTLYRDPDVKFGGQDVGGIRVSHMSHIPKPLKLSLTVSKGKKAPVTVQPLVDAVTLPTPTGADLKALADGLTRLGMTDGPAKLKAVGEVIDREIKSATDLTPAEIRAVLDWIRHEETAEPTLPEGGAA